MADDNEAETPTPAGKASPGKASPDRASPDKASPENNNRNKRLLTGAAIGIGSAALVAALLYANRRRNDRT